jgi:hypothetical protein
MERAGKAEELSKHEAMLLAAQTGLDKARATAKATNYVSSTAINHTDTLFKALSLVRFQPVDNVTMTEREATNTGIMGASSLAFLLLAPMFYFAAGLNRRPGVLDAWIYGEKDDAPRAARGAPEPLKSYAAAAEDAKALAPAGVGGVLDSRFHITDDRQVNELKKILSSHADRALALLNPQIGAAA